MMVWQRRKAARAQRSTEVGFGSAAYARFAERVGAAIELSDARDAFIVASVTVALDPRTDPLTHIQTARTTGESWTAYAQPARDDFSLATLGSAFSVVAGERDRFSDAAELCGECLEAAMLDDLTDDPQAPPGAGVIWSGGFAFLDDETFTDVWRELPSLVLTLPRVSIARRGGSDPQARMTLTTVVRESDAKAELAAAEELVDRLALDELPASPAFVPRGGESTVSSVAPPEHYERAVEEAAGRIRDGEFEKIVLAREINLRREKPIDPFNAFRGLTEAFPECTTFASGGPETTFIGASPELLIRREGRRASTMALAGSTRRGADPETDALLGSQLLQSSKDRKEHDIVVKRIERVLGRRSAWIAAGEAPELVKVRNIQHLATPIRAQLTEPLPVTQLADMLHPTPAVGGDPWSDVRSRIKQLEGFDRGWYTGGVGWTDLFEDGEFHVALRSAVIDGVQARLFAGCGIVGDSDPASELAETETKLQALLPVLSLS